MTERTVGLLVVDDPGHWPFDVPGVEVVAARAYLTDERFSRLRRARVHNLCRSYRYQSTGYYVSLLAEARGHRPRPDVPTLQDMKSQAVLRVVSDELDGRIQKSLAHIKGDRFELSVYFGRNMAERYRRLCLELATVFDAPLLRATFVRRDARWQLQSLRPIAAREIPASHRGEVARFATEYLGRRRAGRKRRDTARYDLAILHDPQEAEPPSDARALKRFIRAAGELGIRAQLVTRDDLSRLGEFDALFIRETTAVNHHTYRFAQRAAAQGLVVIDDPRSIVRCTNKVYLAELFARHDVPAPRTRLAHRDNLERVVADLGFPIVVKRPDGSFSQGVHRVQDREEFDRAAASLLERSELFIAQEFLKTEFDWRVGVLAGAALYVCRYHMAPRHWQIMHHAEGGRTRYGKVETLPVEDAPEAVVETAVRAARLVGDGLYGVDLKQLGDRCYVIEVNDNPNLDSGGEDAVLGEELYRRVMQEFLVRIEARGQEWTP